MNETTTWAQNLKSKRVKYGISQNKLALTANITRPYLSQIETGKTIPSPLLKEKINLSLEQLNPNNPLEMLFDYVRIRFPTDKVEHVIEKILKINMDYMLHEDYAFYGYQEHYRFSDIVIMISYDLSKGTLVELKGKGCRQFESILLAQHRSWFEFFNLCIQEKAIFKRLDLAINDKVGLLDIPELTRKCKEEECISVFRTFKSYRSGELVQRYEKLGMGNTLYIGSLKSEIYFCLYEKDYEQYIKNDIPLEEAPIKNRFEIRLKNERAAYTVNDLLMYNNAEKTIFDIINRYLRFVDKDNSKRRTDWPTNEQWKVFIGKERGKLKLTTSPEPYSFERTLNWLRHQVAPTLKIAKMLDIINKTDIVDELIREAHLNERHEKLLEQQSYSLEDMIL